MANVSHLNYCHILSHWMCLLFGIVHIDAILIQQLEKLGYKVVQVLKASMGNRLSRVV